ncbi:MAG: GHKL domain-containing protein, partial [Planctomycetes bacterium]|nr:GHKL domain-containing protein [Planctomycetota bacterium]
LSNIELQDFAHVVAHDLKSPVRAIGTLANWLAADSTEKFDKTVRENLDLLLVRAEHMNKMIDGILQYSGLGRNENIIKKQVDLNKLVSRVIQDVCPDNNISIEVESNLPSITCEEIRLSQIFQNLLDNAIKYLDKPKGQIKVGCIDDHDYWRFFVADNGSGIEEKFLDKIFDLFETLHSIDDQESVGLGLSLVKKIIEIYGGRIWAESELGDGSTFFFTLPKKERISTDETVKANTFS